MPIPSDSAATGRPLAVSLSRQPTSANAQNKQLSLLALRSPDKPSGAPASPSEAQPATSPAVPGTAGEPESNLTPRPDSSPAPLRRRSATDRISAWIARPVMAAPAVIACLAVLAWCVFVRRAAHPLVVHARPAGETVPAPSAEEVASLERQVAIASTSLITNIDQLPRLISSLEQQARAAGFVVEVTTLPPVSPVPGIPELARHPIVFKLENATDRAEPAFHRLLGWLRGTATLGVKVEPGAITLESPGPGLSLATVELSLVSVVAHAKTPAE